MNAIDFFSRRFGTELGGSLKLKVINRGKCMLCGKELTDGIFFCKECEAKRKEIE